MKSFLFGLTAGLAVGYLTAPRSGREARQRLADMASERGRLLSKQWQRTQSGLANWLDHTNPEGSLAATTAYGQPLEPTVEQRT